MKSEDWGVMPTSWILENQKALANFKWNNNGSDVVSGLAIYLIMCSKLKFYNNDVILRFTYDELVTISGYSRMKISKGLCFLVQNKLIKKNVSGRSSFEVSSFKKTNDFRWAKVPSGFFSNYNSFGNFSLRKKTSLNALKIYLLFLVYRDKYYGYASIGYNKISEYSGVHRKDISTAISMLIENGFIQVGNKTTNKNVHNIYWVKGLSQGKMTSFVDENNVTIA